MSIELIDESVINADLFNAPERFKVVTVNCVGAMGRGIAEACKNRYPDLYKHYRKRCFDGEIVIGKVYVYSDEGVILLPTKTHFKYKAQVSYVINGVTALAEQGEDLEGGIAVPPLGMAHGWLAFNERWGIYQHLNKRLQSTRQNYSVYLPARLLGEANRDIPNSLR